MTTGFQQQTPLQTFTVPRSAPTQQNGQRSEPARFEIGLPKPPRSFQPRPGLTLRL